jgi:zinc protease
VTERPRIGPPRPYQFPQFTRARHAGGTVLACHLPGRPLTSVVLVADAGAVTEPAGREGVAALTARMLAEGTRRRSAFEFAVAAERLGASWHADADYDSMRVGFDVPADGLVDAVRLIAEAASEPAFEPEAFDRVRAERSDELTVEWSQPAPRASAAFAQTLWEAGSRYAFRDGGSPQTIANISLADLVAFHGERLRPERAALVVAGDLAATDPERLAEAMFGAWPTGGPAGPAVADPVRPTTGGRRVVVVDRPRSVQSVLLVGHQGPSRATPDYVPLTTLGLAFGGMFNSRVNYKLREERGFTYGAFGGFELRRHAGVFAVRAAVEASVTAPALADTVAEVVRLHESGLTETEVAAARGFRVGVFPVSFAEPGAVARALGDLVVHGLPDDYYDRIRSEAMDVSLEAVNRAAAERVFPDRLVSVVVGDAGRVDLDPACGPVTTVAD